MQRAVLVTRFSLFEPGKAYTRLVCGVHKSSLHLSLPQGHTALSSSHGVHSKRNEFMVCFGMSIAWEGHRDVEMTYNLI
ncbi:hypothetical protein SCLCIDRAFT_832649 [Scleroderma citrinum Foug A]|uniref:Uncharacterized protein n=1 Tax=Scleroderma citrinum Foug A TaxID=1036808 RepID=A0A0C3DNR4_9AGAM|nr:hypothetical protein SCLCIDRAFT_832649 [Scleroderma citrinum Foug A]